MLQIIAIIFQHETVAENNQAVTKDSKTKLQQHTSNLTTTHSFSTALTEVINTTAAQRQNEETENQHIELLYISRRSTFGYIEEWRKGQ